MTTPTPTPTKPPLPDLEFTHNTDLNPSDDYLATVPRLRRVLHRPELGGTFGAYDRVANSARKTFQRVGLVSVALASVSLLGTIAELCARALSRAGTWSHFSVPLELCGVAAVLIALGLWFSRSHAKWLVARFMTEQMRLWHFQSLMDGAFIGAAAAAPDEFEKDRAVRLARFQSQTPNAVGAMSSFIDSESTRLFFEPSPYRDPSVADEVFRAYADLRISKQLAYFRLKKEEVATRDEWSEGLAKFTLFGAVLLSAGQLLLAWAGWGEAHPGQTMGTWMQAAALALVVLSAAVRVYRSALAVPVQREHYEGKWVRLVALQAQFEAARSQSAKLAVMGEFELVELEELRYFLRVMRKASFLL